MRLVLLVRLVWLLMELHLASPLATSVRPLAMSLETAAGQAVSPYILGGAARSVQPQSLPKLYHELLSRSEVAAAAGSPGYFAYNPHRYPAFMQGIRDVASDFDRESIFLMSGGGERSESEMDARLDDAIELMGAGSYLDAFILEVGKPRQAQLTLRPRLPKRVHAPATPTPPTVRLPGRARQRFVVTWRRPGRHPGPGPPVAGSGTRPLHRAQLALARRGDGSLQVHRHHHAPLQHGPSPCGRSHVIARSGGGGRKYCPLVLQHEVEPAAGGPC